MCGGGKVGGAAAYPLVISTARATGTSGETMEVLGLILPDGDSVVVLLDDVDLVDGTDPIWRALVAGAIDASPAHDE